VTEANEYLIRAGETKWNACAAASQIVDLFLDLIQK
jgi:hypothetical protein